MSKLIAFIKEIFRKKDPVEEFLAKSTDIYDLERRYKILENKHLL